MTEKLDIHAIETQIEYGIMPDEFAHRLIPKLIARIRALESASQPGIDALATAMHHAAIKYASGDLVDFQHEAREFLLASQPGSGEAVRLLAEKHAGMRVDYHGLFKQARAGLRKEPALAEMLRQFQDHMTELGRRWYAGDTAVVDEMLQLYCVEREARAALAAPSAGNGEAKGGREES